MPIDEALLLTVTTVGIFMTGLYMLAQLKRDTSIVDIAWGLGFVVVAASLFLSFDGQNDVFRVSAALVTAWGVRLFAHIFARKAGEAEDWRYQNWREQWGKTHWWRSFLQVFMLQGLMMIIIAAPLYISLAAEDTSLHPLALVGIAVWLLGFYFETVGDYQLTKFIAAKKAAAAEKKSKSKKKKGKKQPEFMMEGLWKYTRHPNYFGEVTQWWGLWLVVLPTTYGLWAIISPLTISFLLLRVSGIPMLEKKWEGNKEFAKYKQRTNAFFPGAPKKK